MDSLERAIRSALEKGDPGDPDFRKRVYRSALNALEKSIASDGSMPAEKASGKRDTLKDLIRRVETEFKPAVAPQNAEPTFDMPAVPDIPSDEREPAASDRVEPSNIDRFAPSRHHKRDEKPLETPPPPPKNSIFGIPFIVGSLILLAIAVFLYKQYGDAPAQTAVIRQQGAGGAPGEEQDASKAQDWIDIFTAANPATSVLASTGTGLEVLDREEEKFLRVTAKGDRKAAVMFDVGSGVLQQIAGKNAIFEVAARSEEGKNVQIAIECDFGALGACGRRRYEVVFTPRDYLFEVKLGEGAANSAGKIVITPDTAGTGAYIDISKIRVTLADQQ